MKTAEIAELLALPQKERRKIAEKLWQSLSPSNAVSALSGSEKKLLQQRWKKYAAGKTKFYSSREMKKIVFG